MPNPPIAATKATSLSDNRSLLEKGMDWATGDEASGETTLGSTLLAKALKAMDQFTRGHLRAEDPKWQQFAQQTGISGEPSMGMAPLGPKDVEGVTTGIKGLYSRLSKAAEDLPTSFHPNKAISMLGQRASKEELAHTGVDKLLKDAGDTTLTKELVQRKLAENPLKVEVKTLGEKKYSVATGSRADKIIASDLSEQDARALAMRTPGTSSVVGSYAGPPTKYAGSNYNLPGGKNYRETLIKLPVKTPKTVHEPIGPGVDHVTNAFNQMENEASGNYISGHWPEDPNVLVHTRYDERVLPSSEPPPSDLLSDVSPHDYAMSKGSKGRFRQEVQSDWEKLGRDQGYKLDPAEKLKLEQEYKDAVMQNHTYTSRPDYNTILSDHPDAIAYEKRVKRAQQLEDLLAKDDYHSAPDNPFKDKVYDLATKQQIMDVVNSPDLEWLGHTPAQVHIDRYGTDRFRWTRDPATRVEYTGEDPAVLELLKRSVSGLSESEMNLLRQAKDAGLLNRQTEGWRVSYEPQVGGRHGNIDDIGAEALRRGLIDNHATHVNSLDDLIELLGYDQTSGVNPNQIWKRMQASPEVGEYLPRAEGFRQQYDVNEPNRLNKILKPFGGRVEQANVPLSDQPPKLKALEDHSITRNPHRVLIDQEGKDIASLWPPRQNVDYNENMVGGITKGSRADQLINLIKQTNPAATEIPSVKAPIVRFPPSMKEDIKKKGLSLLMLLLARQAAQTPQAETK